ncbi:Pentatricopeptide repeat-containing protein, partial [Thalictrum thalictroides]
PFGFHKNPAVISVQIQSQPSVFSRSQEVSPLQQSPTLAKDHSILRLLLLPSSVNCRLITIFTKRLYNVSNNKEEMQLLGEKLNPYIVEIVLKGFKSWRIANDFFLWASEQKGYEHNCYTYNTMASIHSKFQKTTRLKFLALDVVNSRCRMTPGALGFFIRCLSSHGLVDEAVYLFEQLKRLKLCVVNSYSYNCLIEAIAKSGRFEFVEMRLTEMRDEGWEVDKFTLTPILQAYCNARKFDEALIIFNQIYDRGWVDEHVFTILMIAFSKWGEVDKAFELIERMEDHNMRPTEKTLCSLIHGFTRELRVDKALQLFDKMRILAFNPDLPLYSVLIEGLCKTNELDKALYLYTEMKSFKIFPDAYVYKNLISSFSGQGDLVTANKLLEEGEEELDLAAMVVLYNAILDSLVSKGLTDKAYLLVRAMMGTECIGESVIGDLFRVKKTVLPNYDSFAVVIDGLCKTTKLDEALVLFRDMIHMGCERTVILYNNVINALCDSNRLEESFELLREMKESGFKPTEFTHNCICGCLCTRENISAVLDLLREMRVCGHEPWIKHYSGLVKQLCSQGKAVEACGFLADIVREGFLPDIIAYSAAIDGLFKIREVDRAMELFQDISTRGHGPDVVAYNIVIDGLCKVERVLDARKFLNEMFEKGLLPSVVTYNSMVDGLCKANDIDQAFHYYKEMISEGREPTIITFTTLIDGLCNGGRPDDALMLWNEMIEQGCAPNRIAYMALVYGLCKCNTSKVAQIYFNEMKEKEMRPDTYVYVALITAHISNKDLFLALEILKEMVHKEEFPASSDKNYPILVEALRKFSENSTTSLVVQNLISEGCIPAICSVSEEGDKEG